MTMAESLAVAVTVAISNGACTHACYSTMHRVPCTGMKYKRRIVYLDDPTWRKLAHLAKWHGGTISGTVRDLITEPIAGEMMQWEVMLPHLEGKVVHHIDGDASNNDPENLELRKAPKP